MAYRCGKISGVGTAGGVLAPLMLAVSLSALAAPPADPGPVAATSQTGNERHINIAIEWDPATPVNERELWMAYLFTRAAHIAHESEHTQLPLGEREPSFDEEVRARRVAVNLFRQLERDHPSIGSIYFADLDRVDAAGFLREYVWRYLRSASWTNEPHALNLAAFDAWRHDHLRHHVPRTHGGIALRLSDG